MDLLRYDFGYSWPWTHGHLLAALLFTVLALLAWRIRWPRWTAIGAALLAGWGLAAFLIVQGALRIDLPLELPTERFLSSGSGRVLDAGAGSGRSALMVLRARPGAQVVALDLFRTGYGIGDNTPARLYANARLAGVADRVTALEGDMRQMPLPDASFDAAVSAYAIDHLSRDDTARALRELSRVLRPDGELLLMVIHRDLWVRIAYPLLLAHGYFGPSAGAERWRAALEAAGFEVVEHGARPTALYLLARKRSA